MDKRKKQIQNYIRIIFMAVTVIVMFLLYNIYIYAEDEEVLCIELDPGHGGVQSGAEAIDGVTMEKDINLALAKALKKELEKYENIKIRLTRTGDKDMDLEERTETALVDQADFMISLHNNAYGPVAPYDKGSTVLVANGNYNKEIAEEEYKIGVNILYELSKIGLENQGLMIRDSEEEETYDNGKIADYYGLIRAGILQNIPTIIVEHAFVDNEDDFENFLSNDEKIEKIAKADARGIARYFQLKKKATQEVLPALTNLDEKIVHVIDENGNHNINSTRHFDTAVSNKVTNTELPVKENAAESKSTPENSSEYFIRHSEELTKSDVQMPSENDRTNDRIKKSEKNYDQSDKHKNLFFVCSIVVILVIVFVLWKRRHHNRYRK